MWNGPVNIWHGCLRMKSCFLHWMGWITASLFLVKGIYLFFFLNQTVTYFVILRHSWYTSILGGSSHFQPLEQIKCFYISVFVCPEVREWWSDYMCRYDDNLVCQLYSKEKSSSRNGFLRILHHLGVLVLPNGWIVSTSECLCTFSPQKRKKKQIVFLNLLVFVLLILFVLSLVPPYHDACIVLMDKPQSPKKNLVYKQTIPEDCSKLAKWLNLLQEFCVLTDVNCVFNSPWVMQKRKQMC